MPDHAKQGAIRLLASAVAAGIAETITLPIDTVKVRLQVQLAGATGDALMYKGTFQGGHRIIVEEGLRGLWKGYAPAMMRQCSYTGLTWILYEPVRNALAGHEVDTSNVASIPFWKRVLAGGISGGIGIAVMNPTEVIKTQLQANRTGNLRIGATTREIWRTERLRGFWAGVSPNVARCFVGNAAEIGTYDHAKHYAIDRGWCDDNIWAHLGASATASVVSAVVSTPVDVLKVRLMNQAGHAHAYSGVIDATRTIVREEGPMALYKGFLPLFYRKALWCVSFFVSMEQIKRVVMPAPAVEPGSPDFGGD